MTSLLNRLFGRSRRGSGATAKQRLHFVLQHDRINLPPERAEAMKSEILAVIVKYLAVDQERVEIALEQRDRTHSKLVAELPIVNETYSAAPQQAERSAAVLARSESNGVDKSDEGDAEATSDDSVAEEDEREKVDDKSTGDASEGDAKREAP